MQKFLMLLIVSCCIAGCHQHVETERVEFVSLDASHSKTLKLLTDTAKVISQDLNSLKSLEKSVTPLQKSVARHAFSAIKELVRTELEWIGPVESLLTEITKRYHYKFKILGRPPAIPLLVTLWVSSNTPLSEVMFDIDAQLGAQANIKFYTEFTSPTIELCYVQ